MKRVLLTGAGGFLGKASISFLIQAGYEVHTVSKGSTLNLSKVTHHNADLLNASETEDLFAKIKPTHLLHYAWVTGHRIAYSSQENLDWLASGCHMLKAFLKNGGERFVSSGTCSEYDSSFGVLNEQTPVHLDSPYASTKRSFFEIASAFSKAYGLSYACGRIFFLYGPGDKEQKAIPNAIRSFLNKENVVCNMSNAVRDYMHIDDCAQAFASLLDSNVVGPVNIASGKPLLVGTIFSEISKILNCEHLLTLNNVNFFDCETANTLYQPSNDPVILADTTRMTRELGHINKVQLIDGLKATINANTQAKSDC